MNKQMRTFRAQLNGLHPRHNQTAIKACLALLVNRQCSDEIDRRRSLYRNGFGLSASDASLGTRIVCAMIQNKNNDYLSPRKMVLASRIVKKYPRQLFSVFGDPATGNFIDRPQPQTAA